MGIRSENEIYGTLERALRAANEPLTCTDLMEIPNVRARVLSEFGDDIQLATNKLSDTLGFMWRRDVLIRHPAPPTERTRARFAYSWRENPISPSAPLPPSSARKKPVFTVVESNDSVRIEFEHVTLIVRRE